MQYFYYSGMTWIVLLVCGLPFAILLAPGRLKPFRFAVAPIFGYCYLVYVSYLLYRFEFAGANSYALPVFLAPLIVTIVLAVLPRTRSVLRFSGESGMAIGLALACFMVLSWLALALAHGRAVAFAIANMDVVELASISRYLQEFARSSTAGFFSQSEWFRYSCDNNWFGPSAIVAVVSALGSSEPFRLQTLVMNVIAAQGVVGVYAITRAGLSLSRASSFAIGLIYAASPVIAYTVWQSFGGQMISISLLLMATLLFIVALEDMRDLRTALPFLGAIVLLFSGLFVSYHFMIAIIGMLLGGFACALAVFRRSIMPALAGGMLLAVAVGLTAILNPPRISAILETLSMINSGNGWFIPWLSPDIQLGFNAAVTLVETGPRSRAGIGVTLVVVLAALTALALVTKECRPVHRAFVCGLVVPSFLLGLYFATTEAQNGVLGSYRSFKITGTFSAFVVIALGMWFGIRPRRWFASAFGAILAVGILAVEIGQLSAMIRFADHNSKVSWSGYIPSDELMAIKTIEAMDSVSGLGISRDSAFDLFWAHYFLLHKRQVFEDFPYPGRWVGALVEPYRLDHGDKNVGLAGDHDIFSVESTGCVEKIPINSRLRLCKPIRSSDLVITAGQGWWDTEPGAARWTGRNGRSSELTIENASSAEIAVRIRGVHAGMRPDNVFTLNVNGIAVPVTTTALGFVSEPVTLRIGSNDVRLTEAIEPSSAGPGDRTLGTMWRSIAIERVDLARGS